MKIVYDNIIFARQKMGGISVVWYELISRALKDKNDLFFIDFQPTDNPMRSKLDIKPSQSRVVDSKYRKILKYFPVYYRSKEPFIFHSSYYRYCICRNAINVTTVHDFTNEYYQKGLAALKDRWIKHNAIRHSDYIICISENTRNDFFKFFPKFPKDKVFVVYNGVSDEFYPLEHIKDWKYPIAQKDYFLFVGERGGYKNFQLVVDALKEYDANLIIVGAELSQAERQELSNIKGRYHYAGRVSTDELNKLYNGAKALLYPSSYEGFGLPVVEAQRAGCHIIAMNASSIPEVIGNSKLLFEKATPCAIVEKMQQIQSQSIASEEIRLGHANSNKYDWATNYREISRIYRLALSNYSK